MVEFGVTYIGKQGTAGEKMQIDSTGVEKP
jgi:hypothetical protein